MVVRGVSVRSLRLRRLGKMVIGAGLLVVVVAGCSPTNNEFVVVDQSDAVASAELQLCGERRLLERKGNVLAGTLPVKCEGHGRILVHLRNERTTICPVGYVTPGAEQTFRYQIEDGQCR